MQPDNLIQWDFTTDITTKVERYKEVIESMRKKAKDKSKDYTYQINIQGKDPPNNQNQLIVTIKNYNYTITHIQDREIEYNYKGFGKFYPANFPTEKYLNIDHPSVKANAKLVSDIIVLLAEAARFKPVFSAIKEAMKEGETINLELLNIIFKKYDSLCKYLDLDIAKPCSYGPIEFSKIKDFARDSLTPHSNDEIDYYKGIEELNRILNS